MKYVVFDIDGTLVESFEFDEQCFTEAVLEVAGKAIDTNWEAYENVTDSGLLMEARERSNINIPLVEFEAQVKKVFIDKISSHIDLHGVRPVEGAIEIIETLNARDDIAVGLATGGWLETARLKLVAAGFGSATGSGLGSSVSLDEMVITSSNDHYRRTEIMQLAVSRLSKGSNTKPTRAPMYFGDAPWDSKACLEIGYEFVLVGNRMEVNGLQIDHYLDQPSVNQVLRRLK